MRFVFLNPVAEFGGGEQSLISWMKAVTEAFPQAEIVLIVPALGPLADRARAGEFELKYSQSLTRSLSLAIALREGADFLH